MTLRLAPEDIVAQSTSPLLATAAWWERCRLGEVATVTNGAAFKSNRFNTDGDGLPLIRIRDVGQPRASTHYSGDYESRHLVESGDLLVGMDGDFRIARWTGGRALLNQRVCRLQVADPDLYCDHFLEYVLQPYLDEIHKVTSSVTVKHLSSRTLTDLPIPLPSRTEQQRIVAAIEEHFSYLDAAESDITAASAKSTSLSPKVVTQLFSNTWPIQRLEELARVGRGATPKRSEERYWAGGTIPWVTSGAVNDHSITSASELITEEALTETSVKLWPAGTVLVAMYGEGKTRGKAAVLEIESTCNQACAAIDYDRERVDGSYLLAYLNSRYEASRSLASGGVQPNLSLGVIKSMEIPIPNMKIQRNIALQAQDIAHQSDLITKACTMARQRIAALRRSILITAFSGQLVPQDPDDEAASVLLQRIAASRLVMPRQQKVNG